MCAVSLITTAEFYLTVPGAVTSMQTTCTYAE